MYGGYNAGFNIRDIDAYQTAIVEHPNLNTPGAVNAVDIGSSTTVLDGFSVFGTKDSSAGAILMRSISRTQENS